jgi:RDD family
MRKIFLAGALGLMLVQAFASERSRQFGRIEAPGQIEHWRQVAEWLSGKSITISNDRNDRYPGRRWEIGSGKHQGDLVLTGENFVLGKGESTAGDLVLIRGHAKIEGTVNGDCVFVGSEGDVAGTINGGIVSVASKLHFSPKTVVNGDFVSVASAVTGTSEIEVNGDRMNLDVLPPDTVLGFYKWFSGTVLLLRPMSPDSLISWFAAFFVLAFCLAIGALFPRLLADTGKILQQRTPAALLSGLAIVPAAALFCFLLLVTVLGIFVIPFVIATLVVFSLIGNAAVFQAIGKRLAPKLEEQKHGTLAWIGLGAIICWVIYSIPVIGFLAGSIVFLAGLGAFSLYVVDRARPTPVAQLKAPAAATTTEPGQPAPSQPAPSQPAPSQPTPSQPAPSQPASSQPTQLLTSGINVDFWRRLGANLIDLVIIYSLLQFTGIGRILVPGWVLYRFGMYVWRSATLGEIVLNLRVEKLAGGSLIGDYGTALVRALSSLLSLLPLGLGFFWILFDPQRQTWHDKISGSIVVPLALRNGPANPPGPGKQTDS